jgi:hypothetical protein
MCIRHRNRLGFRCRLMHRPVELFHRPSFINLDQWCFDFDLDLDLDLDFDLDFDLDLRPPP